MPNLNVTRTSEYAYHNPAGLLRHRLMIRPHDSHDLWLHAATIAVEPESQSIRWAHDVLGNSVSVLDWASETRTTLLHIVSALMVTHNPSGSAARLTTRDSGAETFPFSYAAERIPDLGPLTERQFPDPDGLVDGWARGFVTGAASPLTLGILEAMTQAIQQNLRYPARDAEGTQTPADTLTLDSGTCRDFALLMMEAAGSLGFAARFVTGYLYDCGATLACCTVYLPGAGRVEYGRPNRVHVGVNFIRVEAARAPSQALPAAAGYLGNRADPKGLSVDVTVEVTQDEAALQAA